MSVVTNIVIVISRYKKTVTSVAVFTPKTKIMENKTYMIPPIGGKSMLQTVEDVEAYDYTAGYPERLVFEL